MPRTRKKADPNRWLEIANLRYKTGLTNSQIAKRLGIGAKQVKSLLEESVNFLLSQQELFTKGQRSEPRQRQLEDALRIRFPHLLKVKIVPAGKIKTERQYNQLIERLAIEAAMYFETLVNSGDLRDEEDESLHVAVSGGQTNLLVMNSLPEHRRDNVYFHASAALGRGAFRQFHIDPATNVTIGWVRSGRVPGRCIYTTIPPFTLDFRWETSLFERKEVLIKQLREIAKGEGIDVIIPQLDRVTIALAGIGMVKRPENALKTREALASELLGEAGISPVELYDDGAIGDFSYCFFDKDGRKKDDWQFFLTAGHLSGYKGVDFYREMVRQQKQVILIAGPFKIPAIQAALRGKLFNVWFTDEDSARATLGAK